ncbi:LytTR family DNA-binding domain-containing protein [Aureisphaera galaxeae]|uniref:LytTR family DNA-binding domain-containing protein n=1 Tax=Aureisphaera galaxeae TaxID=1538023 RepID=UPI00234FCB25|nr:LytTR family DNA-binding domain-containing protein [Aureisphaera galaxeae]MDC8002504.1 LytTR family DNA-binding domain-containing protein [Aureisphaera galaxeae]
MKTLNPSIKHHLIIGIFISIWSFLFSFFSRPFEHGTMDTKVWILVSVGYSLIGFISYAIVSFFQKYLFQKLNRWGVLYEVSIYVLFYVLYTTITYGYYRSPIIRGIYDFPTYFLKIIVNVFLILTPILFFIRRYSIKLIPPAKDDITIKGENKLDVLKIKQSELICISNSQNYVEIFYVENNELKSKLIRSSLKKMQTDFDFLLQVHRSHLINPAHFKSWKDSTTISLTQMELPVSKNYKSQLLSL